MDPIDLVGRYVHDVKCDHCNGRGKCKCDWCKGRHANNYTMVWEIENPRPLPTQLTEREMWRDTLWEVREKGEKWAKTVDTCAKCGGKGTIGKVNYERLDQEVDQGIITEHQRMAILGELGKFLGSSYAWRLSDLFGLRWLLQISSNTTSDSTDLANCTWFLRRGNPYEITEERIFTFPYWSEEFISK